MAALLLEKLIFLESTIRGHARIFEEGSYAEGRGQKEQLNGDSDPNEKVGAV